MIHGQILKKGREALVSVMPITAIVVLMHLTVAPLATPTLVVFLIAAVLLVLGMSLFTLGTEMAMMPMGELIGGYITKSRNLGFLMAVSLIMGVLITVAEPDLQVLAEQVPAFPNTALIWTVALGVGVFLVVATLRIVLKIPLNYLLTGFYVAVFVLAFLSDRDFLPVAFDSGGVTTGPITVPFILALGIGVAAVRGGRSSQDDSFGLVALCSIGPIVAVFVMGLFYDSKSAAFAPEAVEQAGSMTGIWAVFAKGFPKYAKEVALALMPIVGFFAFFQLFWLRLPRRQLIKMGVGVAYTFAGLVIFLTGVNVGFMPVGNWMGASIARLDYNWILVPIGMLMGYFIVKAEPAVHVLNNQVEEITDGAISKRAMMLSLSLGIAVSLGLAMLRVLTGVNILLFLIPGYALSLALSFFVPRVFTAIAFDSGGVASGPMTATFLLPFAMGASSGVDGNLMADAFGLVAMVAMTPLIAIQLLAFVYSLKLKHTGAVPVGERPDDEMIDFE